MVLALETLKPLKNQDLGNNVMDKQGGSDGYHGPSRKLYCKSLKNQEI